MGKPFSHGIKTVLTWYENRCHMGKTVLTWYKNRCHVGKPFSHGIKTVLTRENRSHMV
jgi:hypothetical protein